MVNLLFCCTDLVRDEQMQYSVGFIFIFLLAQNICTHLFFMFRKIIWFVRTAYAKK